MLVHNRAVLFRIEYNDTTDGERLTFELRNLSDTAAELRARLFMPGQLKCM